MRRARLLTVIGLVATSFAGASPGAYADGDPALKTLLQSGANPGLVRYTPALRKSLADFYAARDHDRIWTKAKARALLESLAKAGDHGLVPRDYSVAAIRRLPESSARRELLLSAAAALYAGDLSAGRFAPRSLNREIHFSPVRVDAAAALGRLAAASDVGKAVSSFAPQRPEYERLRRAYLRYRDIVRQGGWPRIAAAKGLSRGNKGPAVAALRARLAATGDLPKGLANGDVYDDAVAAAVIKYQSRNGLFPTGIVNWVDLKALNQTAAQRLRQIQANLERRRWLQESYGPAFLLVNQADFMVKLVRGTRTVYTSKIIIGTRTLRTPVFRAALNEVGFNPVWNVPRSITRNEFLPALKRNPNAFLNRRNMSLHDPRTGQRIDPGSVDWSQVGRGNIPFLIRQAPGARNALGRVKFMFPNPYNVYLHDTPSKQLFERRLRCFSHGCMRLADPIGLAENLLRDKGWTRAKIQAAINSGVRRSVYVSPPVPVFVVYLTAWSDKDGSVQFREDVYNRDPRVEAAFARLTQRR